MSRRGHQFTFFSSDITLAKFGEYMFDNIIIFATKKSDFSNISVEDLVEFVNDGGDLLFLTNGEISQSMRLFAATSGVEFDKKGTSVMDHFSFEPSVDSR